MGRLINASVGAMWNGALDWLECGVLFGHMLLGGIQGWEDDCGIIGDSPARSGFLNVLLPDMSLWGLAEGRQSASLLQSV